MTVLLYDYCELEERAAKHLKKWKVWHLILYVLAAIFGVVNYVTLQQAMQLVDNNCVLYPRALEFRVILRPNATLMQTSVNYTLYENESAINNDDLSEDVKNGTIAQDTVPDEKITENKNVTKREIPDSYNTTEVTNATVITGNRTHQTVLDTSRSLFGAVEDCQFAEYMPVMSTVCALVWITLFTMCPGGGRARSGLQQPWRILTPALLFALVLVGLTGHSFSRTNGGLHDFCTAFADVSGSTKCSSVDPFLEASWGASWGFGARAAAARASSAGAWAAWACAAALLLARCLAAPDFVVRRTGVYLKDPHGKLTPHLRKSRRGRQARSPASPGSRRDNASLASDPTLTTELASASVERGQDSAPTSLMATPLRRDRADQGDLIEMTYSPQERYQ